MTQILINFSISLQLAACQLGSRRSSEDCTNPGRPLFPLYFLPFSEWFAGPRFAWHTRECGGFGACGTLAVDPDVHGQLGRHGQEALLHSSLHEPLLLVNNQSHLLFWRFCGFQLLPELLQGGCLSRHCGLGGCSLHCSRLGCYNRVACQRHRQAAWDCDGDGRVFL